MGFLNYIVLNSKQILGLLIQHLELTALAVFLAVAIGVPIGILITIYKKSSKVVIGSANIIQAIPSMALLGFLIPLLGIGTVPAIVAVVLYSLLPIIKNTYIGIKNISPQTVEAAKGIGLTRRQILLKIQVPLALPVIMTGVRISAVTAVGLLTIAAYIGAGGLGYLVFSGIRTVNNYQILAGAIPACILALVIDGLGNLIEKLLVPISLQKGDNETIMKNRKREKHVLLVALILIIFSFGYSAYSNRVISEKNIVVGSKDYSEQEIMGNLALELINEKTDINAIPRFGLGGTGIIFSALKQGEVDLYMEYSGTAYTEILDYPPINDVEEVYQTMKSDMKELYGVEVLEPFNFNNTYILGVRKEFAEKYNLKTVSDFAKVAHLSVGGFTFEFLNREDALLGLEKLYDFKMKETHAIDSSPRYTALINKEVDVVDAFATDGLLKKFDLALLEDDKSHFPPYYPTPIMNADAYSNYPEIIPLLEDLGSRLSDAIMTELNYKVDELGQTPKQVAHDFLVEQGLID